MNDETLYCDRCGDVSDEYVYDYDPLWPHGPICRACLDILDQADARYGDQLADARSLRDDYGSQGEA